MKKTILLFLFVITGFAGFNSFVFGETYELKTSHETLSINKKGILNIVKNKGSVSIIRCSLDDLWKITLKNSVDTKEYVFSPDNYTINKEGNTIQFILNNFFIKDESIPVKAQFTISVKNEVFCFSGWLKSNSEEWLFKELDYPRLSEIMPDIKTSKSIYWPAGLGEYISNSEKFGSKNLWYPSVQGVCMPWFSVNSENTGLYIGSHDSLQATKKLNLSYEKQDKVLSTSFTIPLYKAEYQIPEVVVKPYEGQWYDAAKLYRKWYDMHFKPFSALGWVTNNSGWLLAILKQQNGEVIWNYRDIDQLCGIAQQFNLGTIGLFGWAAGGHDHLYPNFPPDNLMGGREDLKRAIERAQEKGLKIILYANAKIMDTSTDFYKLNGIETILLNNDMRPDVQFYVKQKNATPVIFAQACNGSKLWRKTMVDLGIQAVELGADGILYDQLGVLKPDLCFSNNHDHHPGESDANFRQLLLTEVNEKVKEINPEFIVMTESSTDVIIQSVDYFHGCGIGTAEWRKDFPEMFLYTFPELVTTQRNPNPMLTKTEANFAAIYGMRHEIEIRYPGDKKYVLNGKVTKEDYANVVDPPNLSMLNLYSADESAAYLHALIDFEDEHAEFLRQGRFIDQEGIAITGKDVIAKGFLNGDKLGVLVWNKSLDEEKHFKLNVSGFCFQSACEPGSGVVEETLSLKPNAIRLVIFQKSGS